MCARAVELVQIATTIICASLALRADAAPAEEQRRVVRLYNSGAQEVTITVNRAARTIAASSLLDIDIDATEHDALTLSPELLAVERLPLTDPNTDDAELHVIRTTEAAACMPTVGVRVPLLSCRFGTAEAQVEPITGATYEWSVEGGTILSGNGTPAILIGFGAAQAAVARVVVTQGGCVSSGAAILSLRDPLSATMSLPDANVGTPVRLTWSYNTNEPILTQLLLLPDETTPVRLMPEVRSHVFTPTREGAKTVKLTAALYRIGARRRSVRSGSGPRASSCSFTEVQRELRVRPPCTNPTAQVSGGGSACGSVAIRAQFEGIPPFRGRWSDGVSFETSAAEITRDVAASGIYTIDTFEDANCTGRTTGVATVDIQPPTRVTAFAMSPPQALSILTYEGRISWGYENATNCVLTTALQNGFGNYPSCSGASGSGITNYIPENQAGTETLTFRVSGPCGTDERSVQFFVCGYHAKMAATGPTTFCEGGSVTLSVTEFAGPNAGPPYNDYRFYRCTEVGPSACSRDPWHYELVQRGEASTYVATKSGMYMVVVNDRLGCSSIQTDVVQVTVMSCP